MIESLQNTLALETALFRALHDLERQKSDAIMKADGKLLHDITVRQEKMVHEMDALEAQLRTGIAHVATETGVSPDSLRLSDIQTIVHRNTAGLAKAFDATVHEFRLEAERLQSQVNNNSRLLEGAGSAIQRTMDKLRKESENKGITYTPPSMEGARRSTSVSPIILNKNA